MKKTIKIILIFLILTGADKDLYSEITVKIRDIAAIEGLKENQVFGFGLVVGLQGTGDSKSALIQTTVKNLLNNLGFSEYKDFKSKNIAAVLLTAKLPAFVRIGDRINVTVSSIGDAKSLEGGVLIQSSLRGADGVTYIAAQGPLVLDKQEGRGRSIKTAATIINGGIVEREVVPEVIKNNTVTLLLKNWDYSVATKIIKSVMDLYPESKPVIIDGSKINISIPENLSAVEFISAIESIEIAPSFEARVVINEKDGTIVMGRDVRISSAVVSKDGMTIKIGGGDSVNVAEFKEASTVKDLVESMNYLGASTSDIISILKALKDAGALHATLIVK